MAEKDPRLPHSLTSVEFFTRTLWAQKILVHLKNKKINKLKKTPDYSKGQIEAAHWLTICQYQIMEKHNWT